MTIFRLTRLALDDLRSIGRYTQINWGREQRNSYLAKLDECFHLLAQNEQVKVFLSASGDSRDGVELIKPIG